MFLVLTVPMRNGNNIAQRHLYWRNTFLPYLWGMETPMQIKNAITTMGSYRTYEEWKLAITDSENVFRDSSYRTYEEWKPCTRRSRNKYTFQFLPYLWGMETFFHMIFDKVSRTFLPYLWGMETRKNDQVHSWRSPVLTVPMRNGNSLLPKMFWVQAKRSYRTYEEWKHDDYLRERVRDLVLTVPMRNGNKNSGGQFWLL